MGARIDMENRQDQFERRLKLVEDALEEMIQTRVHHVDLTDTDSIVTEDVKDETPIKKHKTKRTKKTETVGV